MRFCDRCDYGILVPSLLSRYCENSPSENITNRHLSSICHHPNNYPFSGSWIRCIESGELLNIYWGGTRDLCYTPWIKPHFDGEFTQIQLAKDVMVL